MNMTQEEMAFVCHEVIRSYCQALGDDSIVEWEKAPDWQRKSSITQVAVAIANPDATPEDSHNSWCSEKTSAGWKLGPVKDPAKKEHPCLIPYSQLPVEQRAKDYLLHGTVMALVALNRVELA